MMRAVECPESRSGLHLWCGGNAALGNPKPHCIACKCDGEIDDGSNEPPQVRPVRDVTFLEIALWLIGAGLIVYPVLLAVPH